MAAREARRLRFAGYSVAVALLGAAATVVLVADAAGLARWAVVAFCVSSAVTAVAALGSVLHAVDAENREEALRREIAHELWSMAGDVYLDVARSEEWSHVRVETTKLRLSTFPLRYDEAPAPPKRVSSDADEEWR